jgi:hypothetical protein
MERSGAVNSFQSIHNFMPKKKQAGRRAVLLSPENYIRQKSRHLPIYECWINDDWQELRLAHIYITRQHAGGTLTLCHYLVDLGCLGVKDSGYSFNLSEAEYERILDKTEERMNLVEVSYVLVHNIIYAAVEFAEEYGFLPHKDFILTTSCFLEEDSEAIPMIEIECGGRDGKPLFVPTGGEDETRQQQILMQIADKTASKKRPPRTLDDDDNTEWEGYRDEWEEEYQFLNKEERLALFSKLYKLINDQENLDAFRREYSQLLCLCDMLAEELIEEEGREEEVQTTLTQVRNELSIPMIAVSDLPNSLFAGVEIDKNESHALCACFSDAYEAINENRNASKAIKKLHKRTGDAPVIDYLELSCLISRKQTKSYIKELESCLQKYPDYFLFRLRWFEHLYESEENRTEALHKIRNLLIETPYLITSFEQYIFLRTYIVCFCEDANLAQLTAAEEYFKTTTNLPEDLMAVNLLFLFFQKAQKIARRFNLWEEEE